MRVTINTKDLIFALNTTKPTFNRGAKSSACPVLLEVTEDGRAIIISTEWDIKISTRIPCFADTSGCKFAVTHKDLLDLAKGIKDGNLDLIVADDGSAVACEFQGSPFASLPTMTWFESVFTEKQPDSCALVDLADFKIAIQNALLCLGEKYEESLTCISFKPRADNDIVEIASLNDHQFFMKSLLAPNFNSILEGNQRLLPCGANLAAWLKALPKLEKTLEIQSTKDHLYFLAAGSTFMIKTAQYCFPDYDNFLAKQKNTQATFEVYNDQLMTILNSLKSFVNVDDRSFKFDFDSTSQATTITAGMFTDGKKAQRRIAGTYKGSLDKIYFPLQETLDICQALEGKKKGAITFRLTDKEGPAFITNENCPDSLFILMPMMMEKLEQERKIAETPEPSDSAEVKAA